MTLGALTNLAVKSLQVIYSPEESRAITLRIVEHYLEIPSYRCISDPGSSIKEDERYDALCAALSKLKEGCPLQYVLGFTEFCGHRFRVGEGCLIPRPETEELVGRIIDECSDIELGEEPFNILDMCTGSGCIAYSLAAAFPQAMVYGCDISQAALAIACRQRVKLCGARPVLFQADVLKNPPAGLPQFDIIVSNPPYVRESEKVAMHRNVLDYEPSEALFVPDDDPLVFYRAIASWAEKLLSSKGHLFLEINEALGAETASLFPGASVCCDINGRPRFVISKSL